MSVLPHLHLCHSCYLGLLPSDGSNIQLHARALPTLTHACKYARMRVGTLIVATIYLQLIQNRYMF